MAVTVTSTRTHVGFSRGTFEAFGTLTLTGTYVTGGFAFNPLKVYGSLGSSPLPSSSVLSATFFSPTGYIYVLSGSGGSAVVKIYSAPGTELANTTAVPDASVPFIINYKEFS